MNLKNDIQPVSIADAQSAVDLWIKTVGVRYFSPLTNMAILAEETGEVGRIMARRFGDQSFKPGEKNDLADELTEAFVSNLRKKTERDASRHRENSKLL